LREIRLNRYAMAKILGIFSPEINIEEVPL